MRGNSAEGEWLDLVADLIAAPPRVLPDETIAVRLCETFGLTGCSFTEGVGAEWGTIRLWPVTQQFNGLRGEVLWWTRHCAVRCHPLLRFYQNTGSFVPVHTADVPAAVVGDRLLREWDDYGRSIQAGHQIALPLTMSAPRHRAFVMGRSTPFHSAEVAFAESLWRLLVGVDRLVDVLARSRVSTDVADGLRLTSRELAVLDLLAQGLTAAAIGRKLAITERTVHKHLGNSYAKLRVGDRLSAVLRVQELGLLAPPVRHL